MKVIALGGAGDVGRTVVRAAARLDNLHELVIADIDVENSRALAQELAGAAAKVSAQHVDARSSDSLEKLFADADVVLSMAGPFYRFGTPVLDAAIKTQTHYIDICDDWEPTLEMLARNSRAEAAGVTAIVGMGASPGALNLLAVCAARELDELHDLYTAWPIDVPMPGESLAYSQEDPQADAPSRRSGPRAAIVHWMQQISGRIRTIANGAAADTLPLTAVQLDYPGLGSGTAYTVGHPEPVTLHRTLAVRNESACLMVISPPLLAAIDSLRQGIDSARLTVDDAAAIASDPANSPTEPGLGDDRASHGALPPFFALARGMKGGRAMTVGARVTSLPSGLAAATGIPMVILLQQLIEGRITRRGVFAPEQIVDPDQFFKELAPHCKGNSAANGAMIIVEKHS